MAIRSIKELSSAQCLQFREKGILRLMVQQLHEHTFEPPTKSEADFNLDLFLLNFNRKFRNRELLSRKIRIIVQHTAKNKSELKIWDCLEAIRTHTELLYRFIGEGNATEFPDISVSSHKAFSELIKLANKVKNRSIVELFGGVLVILDLLRASMRSYNKALQTGLFVLPQHQLNYAFQILNNLYESSHHIRVDYYFYNYIGFLRDCRSFYEHLVIIINTAYENNDLVLVRRCCDFICRLNGSSFGDRTRHYYRDCGVTNCLTELIPRITDPETLSSVLSAVIYIINFNGDSIREFCFIENSVEMLIDVIVNIEKKNDDVMNAQWYGKQRDALSHIFREIYAQLDFGNNNEQLLANFESRDIAVKLVEYIMLVDPTKYLHNYFMETAISKVIGLLRAILGDSEHSRKRFSETVGAKETVEKFQLCSDMFNAQCVKQIIELV